jgi:hypothetical protein
MSDLEGIPLSKESLKVAQELYEIWLKNGIPEDEAEERAFKVGLQIEAEKKGKEPLSDRETDEALRAAKGVLSSLTFAAVAPKGTSYISAGLDQVQNLGITAAKAVGRGLSTVGKYGKYGAKELATNPNAITAAKAAAAGFAAAGLAAGAYYAYDAYKRNSRKKQAARPSRRSPKSSRRSPKSTRRSGSSPKARSPKSMKSKSPKSPKARSPTRQARKR